MPGFSFASGNAKKLVALPLYAAGALVALVVARSPKQWVFACGSGIGEGSLALLRHVAQADPGLTLTWLARDERDLVAATRLGYDAVLKSSFRGLVRTLRARVIVVTHGFGDANRYGSRGAFLVQLWHGVPLKLIQLDSPATLAIPVPFLARRARAILRSFYRRGYRRGISLMPAASGLVATRLRSAFGLSADRVVITGDPRDDVLAAGSSAQRRHDARALLLSNLQAPSSPTLPPRVLLFAPTWRDGQPDPGLPTPSEWVEIDRWLAAADAVLIVRPHPLGLGEYSDARSDRVHLLPSTIQSDLTPVLSAVDLLITDYSSVAFDYSLTGGPILFIAPDQDSYARTRGLYEPYRQFSGARETRTWSGLLAQLTRFDSDTAWADEVRAHTVQLREKHFAYNDGLNTERLYAEILSRLEQTTCHG